MFLFLLLPNFLEKQACQAGSSLECLPSVYKAPGSVPNYKPRVVLDLQALEEQGSGLGSRSIICGTQVCSRCWVALAPAVCSHSTRLVQPA